MPTYVCHADRGALTDEHRSALAQRFTAVHSGATNAPQSFVQVIFADVASSDHFIGGRPVPAKGVHLHGHIREGRSAAAKDSLARGLRDEIVSVTGLPDDLVWVYLSEIPARQMIEFGRILPLPGHEDEWIESLPDHLQARLRDLDSSIIS